MNIVTERIETYVDLLEQDVTSINKFRSGTELETIETDGGPIPTLSGVIKEIRDSVGNDPGAEVNVVQGTGQSTEFVMSQKAVTDKFVALEGSVQGLESAAALDRITISDLTDDVVSLTANMGDIETILNEILGVTV